MLAWLAALRLVLQTLVVKKYLLARSPGKLFAAIHTRYRPILKFNYRFRAVLVCVSI
jgi:hypothetical protein